MNNSQLPDGYKLTEVGMVPEDWEVQSLEDLTEKHRPISYGIVQTGPNIPSGIPCLRVIDIDNGRIDKTELIHTSQKISDGYKRTILKLGDLVMPLRGKVGDVGIIDSELEGANLTRGVAIIAICSHLSGEFCRHFISWSVTRKRLEQAMNGSALQEIPIAALRTFKIGLPSSITEQRSIATALSDMDELLGGLDRLIAKKRDLKQAVMQQLLTGKTRLLGFGEEKGYKQTEVGVIPESWDVTMLGQHVNISSGESPSKFELVNQGIPYFKVEQLSNDPKYLKTTPYYLSRGKTVPAKSLIFAKRGASILLNKIRILAQDSFMDTNLMTLTVLDTLEVDFLYYFLDHVGLSQVADTTSIPQINNKHIFPFLVPFPKLEEQTAIASILSDMDTEIAAIEQRRNKTRDLKQAMMQELLTGRIRLKIEA